MNIKMAYNMLLGRPWIHSASVVPSSFYQKNKYVMDGKLVIICVEESLLVIRNPLVSYIEAGEDMIELFSKPLRLQW